MDPNSLVNLLVPLAGMATGAVIVVTLGRLIRHWVDRHYDRTSGGEHVKGEIERLRGEVRALGDLEDRMVELEERVDFTERLLAQQRARELPRDGGI